MYMFVISFRKINFATCNFAKLYGLQKAMIKVRNSSREYTRRETLDTHLYNFVITHSN